MTDIFDKHSELEKEYWTSDLSTQLELLSGIEEFCIWIRDNSPHMTLEERRFAWQALRFWKLVYREATGMEITTALKDPA